MTTPEINDREEVQALEVDLGLPKGFFYSLMRESDWSFIIKLHALVEASVTHLLEHELDNPGASTFVHRLNLGGRTGRLQLAQDLGMLDVEIPFLKQLSKIRNDCVHDVRNVTFGFKSYIGALNPDAKKEMLKAFAPILAEVPMVGPNGATTGRDEFVTLNPKLAIWITSLSVLATINISKDRAKLITERMKWALGRIATVGEMLKQTE